MKKTNSFIKKHRFALLILFAFFLLWFFCLPAKLFDNPTSTVVLSRGGTMLGARIADDGQWRFPQMDSVPERFEKCILYFEDEYFYYHPGFNPVAMGKALWETLTTPDRRGGSTITQQVIRLSRKLKKRTYLEKFIELAQATRLEASHSKKEILNLYASNAPFGGNVVGLETAAWRYYGIPASELSWGQSAALAVLPNAPALIFPGKNENLLKAKRDFLLKKLWAKQVIDKTTYELALLERLPGKPLPLPDFAPHLTERIRNKKKQVEQITTTISATFQHKANQIAKAHYDDLSQNQVHNLAILVMDVKTREVLAYVGNAPTTAEHDNFVDITTRPRSTGSILKPFLFAATLGEGNLLPTSLVADIPTVVDGYSPENFDRRYNGAVPANVALSRSLNVPAVRMLREYGLQKFYNRLKALHLRQIDKPADYYGLSLILGGAESSLWDITAAYAGLAGMLNYFGQHSSTYRENEFAQPIFRLGEKANFGAEVASAKTYDAGAVYKTVEALQEVNRPSGEEHWSFFTDAQPIAWKTGTSFGFKDAWAVGITPKYAIGIWAGNADGEGRPGVTGIQAAAPILFDVLRELPYSGWFQEPFDEMVQVEVCSKSGFLAGALCDKTTMEWIPKNGKRTKTCPYHHHIFLNHAETFQVNTSCYPLEKMKSKNWFTLPPVMDYYYAPQHPEYKQEPPFDPECFRESDKKMAFIFPVKNEMVLLPKNFDEQVNDVVFKLAHHDPNTTVYWYLDDTFLGTTQTFHELSVSPKPGNYTLTVMDQEGNTLKQHLIIKRAQK